MTILRGLSPPSWRRSTHRTKEYSGKRYQSSTMCASKQTCTKPPLLLRKYILKQASHQTNHTYLPKSAFRFTPSDYAGDALDTAYGTVGRTVKRVYGVKGVWGDEILLGWRWKGEMLELWIESN